jgi:hypothetical protein
VTTFIEKQCTAVMAPCLAAGLPATNLGICQTMRASYVFFTWTSSFLSGSFRCRVHYLFFSLHLSHHCDSFGCRVDLYSVSSLVALSSLHHHCGSLGCRVDQFQSFRDHGIPPTLLHRWLQIDSSEGITTDFGGDDGSSGRSSNSSSNSQDTYEFIAFAL